MHQRVNQRKCNPFLDEVIAGHPDWLNKLEKMSNEELIAEIENAFKPTADSNAISKNKDLRSGT